MPPRQGSSRPRDVVRAGVAAREAGEGRASAALPGREVRRRARPGRPTPGGGAGPRVAAEPSGLPAGEGTGVSGIAPGSPGGDRPRPRPRGRGRSRGLARPGTREVRPLRGDHAHHGRARRPARSRAGERPGASCRRSAPAGLGPRPPARRGDGGGRRRHLLPGREPGAGATGRSSCAPSPRPGRGCEWWTRASRRPGSPTPSGGRRRGPASTRSASSSGRGIPAGPRGGAVPGTVVRRAEGVRSDAGPRAFLASRELGIREAGVGFGTHVIRAVPGEGPEGNRSERREATPRGGHGHQASVGGPLVPASPATVRVGPRGLGTARGSRWGIVAGQGTPWQRSDRRWTARAGGAGHGAAGGRGTPARRHRPVGRAARAAHGGAGGGRAGRSRGRQARVGQGVSRRRRRRGPATPRHAPVGRGRDGASTRAGGGVCRRPRAVRRRRPRMSASRHAHGPSVAATTGRPVLAAGRPVGNFVCGRA